LKESIGSDPYPEEDSISIGLTTRHPLESDVNSGHESLHAATSPA
jgi:hypothetical protein